MGIREIMNIEVLGCLGKLVGVRLKPNRSGICFRCHWWSCSYLEGKMSSKNKIDEHSLLHGLFAFSRDSKALINSIINETFD